MAVTLWLTRFSLAAIALQVLWLQDRIQVTRAWTRGVVVGHCNNAIWWFPSQHHHLHGNGNEARQSELYSVRQAAVQDNDLPTAAAAAEEKKKVVRIYTRPSLYDLAFGYRDFPQETRNLLKLHEDAARYPATLVLEVAAGPARHCMELDDNIMILKTYAVDNSPEMKEYCVSLRTGKKDDDKLEYLVQDMTQISLPTTVDTAWLLLGSLQHLVTLADAIKCFKSIHSCLNAHGTFILELPHPKEIFEMVECTTNTWTIPLELSNTGESTGGELKVIWGDESDVFDPISHIRNATVGFHLTTMADVGTSQGSKKNIKKKTNEQWIDIVPMKSYTVPELHLLAELTGFRIVQLLGALDSPDEVVVPIDDEELAYRLVCVLQKL